MDIERGLAGQTERPQPFPQSPASQMPGSHSSDSPINSRVLVADDDPIVRTHLRRQLEKWGYEVVTAEDGDEALRILDEPDSPPIAILDWEMPGIEGREICRHIRSKSNSRYVYIMLMTAGNRNSGVLDGLQAGADESFIKPVALPELRARLQTATRVCYQRVLRESEQRFHDAVEQSAVGMALVDLKGSWIQVNKAFADFFGYAPADLLKSTFRELTLPEDFAETLRRFRKLITGEVSNYQLEKRYVHRDGHTTWALLTVSAIVSNSQLMYALVQIQDINKRKQAEAQLQESESLFRAITENAEELIALMDPRGIVHYSSPSFERWLGYSQEDLFHQNCFDMLLHPDDRLEVLQNSKLLLLPGGTRATLIVRFRHKDGTWRTVEAHSSAIRDKHDRVERFVITARIIDDWIAAQEVMRDREEERQLLLDSTAEAIYGLDREGKCTFCNNAFLELLGYSTADELLGKSPHMLIHHHHKDGSPIPVEDCRLHLAVVSGKPIHVDNEVFWRADGTCVPVEYWSHPVIKNNEFVGAVVTFIDITDRRLAEEALISANRESQMVIDSVPSILISLDCDGRIMEWNRAAEATFSLLKQQVHGLSLVACGIDWASDDVQAEIDLWLQTETVHRYENIRFRMDGKTRFLGITVSPARQQSNHAWRLLITGADTTERKLLGEQLKQAQKLEAIGQLAAGIAHEINTPIQYVGDNTAFIEESWQAIVSVLDSAQALRSSIPDCNDKSVTLFDESWRQADVPYMKTEIPRALSQSIDGVRRVAKIVQAMREFSHPGGEEKLAIDINHALETTLTVARNEWRYVADVAMHLDSQMPLVPCHEGEFNQAILNLIVNAAHAIADVVGDGSRGKGTITVSSRCEGDWVEISVQDSGSGIPEKVQSRIFEPFFTTKPIGKGTGQGLALAHAVIVKKHGGKIWFETAKGTGTTFFIRLPLQAAEAKE